MRFGVDFTVEQISMKPKHNRAGVLLNSSGFKGRPKGKLLLEIEVGQP